MTSPNTVGDYIQLFQAVADKYGAEVEVRLCNNCDINDPNEYQISVDIRYVNGGESLIYDNSDSDVNKTLLLTYNY